MKQKYLLSIGSLSTAGRAGISQYQELETPFEWHVGGRNPHLLS